MAEHNLHPEVTLLYSGIQDTIIAIKMRRDDITTITLYADNPIDALLCANTFVDSIDQILIEHSLYEGMKQDGVFVPEGVTVFN